MSLFESLNGIPTTAILGPLPKPLSPNFTFDLEKQEWRSRFLSLSTWAGATATDLELQYALFHWRPGQSPESAVDTLKRRRGAVAAGEVRKLFRAQDEPGEQDG